MAVSNPKYCLHCLQETGRPGGCGICGPSAPGIAVETNPMFLPPGSVLDQRFLVGRVLGYGFLGITYLCLDLTSKQRVAIKEFMPRDLATRLGDEYSISPLSVAAKPQFAYGLKRFAKEAEMLVSFSGHPNVVRVEHAFAANGTYYMVMEYLEGPSLADFIDQRGDGLTQAEAVQITLRILDGLKVLHAESMLHLDIRPSNILITKRGQVKIIGMGFVRHIMGHNSEDPSRFVSDGYSAYEQYTMNGNAGRWTDIYAVGATLYHMITGNVPIYSSVRILSDEMNFNLVTQNETVSLEISDIISRAMEMEPNYRYQNVEEFSEDLLAMVGGGDFEEDTVVTVEPESAILMPSTPQLDAELIFEEDETQPVPTLSTLDEMPAPRNKPSRPEAAVPEVPPEPKPAASSREAADLPSSEKNQSSTEKTVLPKATNPTSNARESGNGVSSTPERAKMMEEEEPEWKIPKKNRTGLLVGLAVVLFVVLGIHFSGVLSQEESTRAKTPETPSAKKNETPDAALSGPPQRVLRLHGSNTIGSELAPALAEGFLRKIGATNVQRLKNEKGPGKIVAGLVQGNLYHIDIQSKGTGTAFKDLKTDACDIGMASRPITAPERDELMKAGLGDFRSYSSEHVLALDGLAILVHQSNEVSKLSLSELADIFSARTADWSEVGGKYGKFNIYRRDEKSGTYDTFKKRVMGKLDITGTAKFFQSNRKLSESVSMDIFGIGFAGLPFIGNTKALAVYDKKSVPFYPSVFTVSTEDYCLSRRLFLYAPENSHNPLVTQFIEYALSSEGQNIVDKSGFVSLNPHLAERPLPNNAPKEYMDLIREAKRLSVNFRFKAGSSELDNKARRDINRVVDFLVDPKYRHKSVILVGFTDNSCKPKQCLALSRNRAEVVAKKLQSWGIRLTTHGFGRDVPVSPNTSQTGREKNNRVELWISMKSTD